MKVSGNVKLASNWTQMLCVRMKLLIRNIQARNKPANEICVTLAVSEIQKNCTTESKTFSRNNFFKGKNLKKITIFK